MKARIDFVTNSSSTAYLIKNTSDEIKTIVDFVKENLDILGQFNEDYDYSYTEKELIESAQKLLAGLEGPGYNQNEANVRADSDNPTEYQKGLAKLYVWKPGEERLVGFGDESGTIIGLVYDYGLRDGGKSESFEYELSEYWR